MTHLQEFSQSSPSLGIWDLRSGCCGSLMCSTGVERTKPVLTVGGCYFYVVTKIGLLCICPRVPRQVEHKGPWAVSMVRFLPTEGAAPSPTVGLALGTWGHSLKPFLTHWWAFNGPAKLICWSASFLPTIITFSQIFSDCLAFLEVLPFPSVIYLLL